MVNAAKAVLILIILFSALVRAEIHPKYYRIDQENAPEYLSIEVLSVKYSPFSVSRVKQVIVTARVHEIVRTATGLKEGTVITISYEHFKPSAGWAGPLPLPLLKKGKIYPAFLKISDDSSLYFPAARGASFEPLIHYD